MPAVCPVCGRGNPDSAAYCGGCGRPLSSHPSDLTHSPVLVGRQQELAILLQGLDDAYAGHGHLVMLSGEAGIGKTWIAREVARYAANRGSTVLWGSCLEGEWQPAYGPWVEAIAEYARAVPPHQLRLELGPGGPPMARLVPQLRTVLADLPEAPPLGTDEERLRIYDAVVQFILGIAREKTVLLVIDDLHCADRDSLRLLRHLSPFVGRSRILVLCAHREPEQEFSTTSPLEELLPILLREADYTRVVVQGLSPREVGEYLAHAAGRPLPGAIVRAIHQETSGNPFYVREVFRHLAEEGKITVRDGRWSTDLSISEMGIPEGVRQVVRRRLSRLSANSRSMLRTAVGFTSGFGFSALQALMETPEETLLDCIDETLRAGLISITGTDPPTYNFAHAIVRHMLYDELNPDRRARLHRRIALALETVTDGREADRVAELAFQYGASSTIPNAARGLPYALKAADRAMASYAHDAAARFLRVALSLSTDCSTAEKSAILRSLAIAEADALMLEKAEITVRDALSAMSESGAPPHARAEFLAAAARALKIGGAGPGVWKPLMEQGLALLREPHDLLWARLMLIRDPFEPIAIGPINAVRWVGHDPEAVAIAREKGNEDDYAGTLEPVEWRSREETEALLERLRSWHNPAAVLRALDVVCRDLLKRHGDQRGAALRYQELLETSEHYGSIPGQAEALMQLAFTHASLGEMSLASQIARRAQDTILRLGPAHELRFGIAALRSVLTYLLDSDWPESAASAAAFATSPAAARNPRGLVAGAYAALGFARTGNQGEATRLLASLTPVIERMEPTMYVHHAAVAFGGSAVWEMGAVKFADSYRRMALGLIHEGFGDRMLAHELTVARMAAVLGNMPEAEVYFVLAQQKSKDAGLRPVQAIAEYDEALAVTRHGKGERERAEALLDSAISAFRSMEMLGWAGRATDLKERLSSPPSRGAGDPGSNPGGLTSRETEVLGLLSAGATNNEIAQRLVLSVRTVERHIANIYLKIGARSRVGATTFALDNGIGRARH